MNATTYTVPAALVAARDLLVSFGDLTLSEPALVEHTRSTTDFGLDMVEVTIWSSAHEMTVLRLFSDTPVRVQASR